MAWTKDYVVLVGAGPGDSPRWLGTGFVVSRDRVVTARHVVSDGAGAPLPALRVRREGGPWSAEGAVTARWLSPDPLDVAVLEVAHGGEAPSHPLAVFSEEATQPAEVWDAQGYPKVREQAPSDGQESVSGSTQRCEPPEATLELDVTAGPDVWNGLSGGAVVVRQRVRGVVRGVSTGWSNKRITATSVAAFLRDEAFLRALGLDGASKEHLDALRRVKAVVQEVLKRHADLVPKVTEKLDKDQAAAATAPWLAEQLVGNVRGERLARALNGAWADFASGSAQRRELARLLWYLLPFASDWSPWVRSGREAVLRGDGFVDLPFSTCTVAEAVLAGIDCRRCAYAGLSPARQPFGAAVHAMPKLDGVPVVDLDGELLAKAVVTEFAVALHGYAPDDPALTNAARMRREVDEHLKFLAEVDDEEERVPRYLHLDDGVLAIRNVGADGASRLRLAVRVLRGALPHLRIVRLGDGAEGETSVALHVGVMFKKDRP